MSLARPYLTGKKHRGPSHVLKPNSPLRRTSGKIACRVIAPCAPNDGPFVRDVHSGGAALTSKLDRLTNTATVQEDSCCGNGWSC